MDPIGAAGSVVEAPPHSPSLPSPSNSTCAWVNLSFNYASVPLASSTTAVINDPLKDSSVLHSSIHHLGSPSSDGEQLLLLSPLPALPLSPLVLDACCLPTSSI